jgi:hypothetical protein
LAEPFLSEIRIRSFVFAPKGWALCNGQLPPLVGRDRSFRGSEEAIAHGDVYTHVLIDGAGVDYAELLSRGA